MLHCAARAWGAAAADKADGAFHDRLGNNRNLESLLSLATSATNIRNSQGGSASAANKQEFGVGKTDEAFAPTYMESTLSLPDDIRPDDVAWNTQSAEQAKGKSR